LRNRSNVVVRNVDFYRATKAFSKKSLELIRDGSALQGTPSPPDDVGALWGSRLWLNQNVLKGTSEYEQALEVAAATDEVHQHFDVDVRVGGAGVRRDGYQYLQMFVTELYADVRGLQFQDDIFEAVYQRMEDFFYRDTFPFRLVTALHAFTMDVDKIELDERLTIAGTTEEEKARLLGSLRDSSYAIAPAGLVYSTWDVDKTFTESDGHSREVSIARRRVQDVCTALRLFKRGTLYFTRFHVEPETWLPFPTGHVEPGKLFPPSMKTEYELSETEVTSFKAFWKQYSERVDERRTKSSNKDPIDGAIHRFNLSHDRADPLDDFNEYEDKLIDSVIGLEALLSDGTQEISYKLSARGAWLLGKSASDRRRIFGDLRAIYNVRSKMAHGSSPKAKDIEIDDKKVSLKVMSDEAQHYLSLTINELMRLTQDKGKKQVLHELDRKIVEGE